MPPISKYEAIGIFGSVAIMAITLLFIRFEFDGQGAVAAVTQNNDRGSVVVVDKANSSDQQALTDALVNASAGGEFSRLVVDDVTIGTGAPAEAGDTVTVHYVGRTQNGIEFDSSHRRGEPFTFTLGDGQVIAGWEEGLIGMKVGGERVLVIPPVLAYGNRQVGPIEPNTTLVFVVEMVSIK